MSKIVFQDSFLDPSVEGGSRRVRVTVWVDGKVQIIDAEDEDSELYGLSINAFRAAVSAYDVVVYVGPCDRCIGKKWSFKERFCSLCGRPFKRS